MLTLERTLRRAAVNCTAALSCLALLVVLASQAKADTLTIAGNTNTVALFTSVAFNGQSFNNNFNVTSSGQTFDLVVGQYSIVPRPPTGPTGSFGCMDVPCLTITGTLTTPAGLLSFQGSYSGAILEDSTDLSVDWVSGSGPFSFTTAEGGSGQLTIELLDFFAVNPTSATQLYDQIARITIIQFTPGGVTPVPEPVSALLLGSGLAAAGITRGRKSRR